MRLSDEHFKLIEQMHERGYVCLSDMSRNAADKVRYKIHNGFDCYVQLMGLTFITKKVASYIELSVKDKGRKRASLREQVHVLEAYVAELEQELYEKYK